MFDPAIERLTPILDEVFATKPRDEWLHLLADADVPAQPVLTRDEFVGSSIAAANDMVVTVNHPDLGEVAMMGQPFEVEAAPGSVRRAAPLLGEHTDEVVADWGRAIPDSPPPEPVGSGGERPLAGVRVIDLASFIAGPVVSRHLAMLGAEVIKVESPGGDPFRAIGAPFESWNQGKQSVILDLTTDGGRDQLRRLASTVDIVIENFRPGVAERLGVDRDTLRAVNPDLVFLSSPGYGLDESMADKPAFDPLVQALGGIMAAQGGDTEPVFLSVPIHDVVTPMLGALGLVTGLWLRDRTDRGQNVRTSLVQSTMVVQAAEYTRFSGRPPTVVGGFDHPGTEHSRWEDTPDGPVWRDGDLTVDVCRTGLTGSPLAEANELLTTTDHPNLGPIVVFGQLVGGAGPAPGPAPALDADGDRIRAALAADPDTNANTETNAQEIP
jgi:crotonobetainyl-CoA:carnitine CoA-transferase CaiB-like acyl-CoA transferase